MTSVPPTQPPAAKCDYCDQRATTLAGDTNGVLVCEDHVRLFAEREIAAAIDAAQHPAAPEGEHRPNGCCDFHRHIADGCCHCDATAAPEGETDASGLTEAEREVLRHAFVRYSLAPNDWVEVVRPAVERIVAERVRVVEDERDMLQRERDEYVSSICFETTCTNCANMLDLLAATQELEDGDHIEAAKSRRIKAQQGALAILRTDRDYQRTRAESAEAAHESLRAGVEALADEWAEDYPGPTAACNRTPDEWATDLRALLAGGGA